MVMKILVKLSVISLLIPFFFCCRENHQRTETGKVPHVISYRSDSLQRSANMVTRRISRERINDASPEEMEEMRRLRNSERAASTEWVKENVKRYSPESWHMLTEYEKLPGSTEIQAADGGLVTTHKPAGTFEYLRGRSRIDMLASMETNVHEIAHAYFDQNVYRYLRGKNLKINAENAQGFIYISPSKCYFVSFPLEAMFPSAELVSVIPDELRTYRFDTYIDGITSTQSDGIIGLLNELHAYYLGSRYCFAMLEPYKVAAGSEASGLYEWVKHTQSTMSAFYEFDFFIKEYLLRMKMNYEPDYYRLLSYKPFNEAYLSLIKLYSDLIDNYSDRINDEIRLLNASGETEASIEKGWLWVKPGNSHVSSGTPVFSEERDILLPVLDGRRYREVEKDFQFKSVMPSR